MSQVGKIRKAAEEKARDIQKARRLLKQLLYALHKSEGFGEDRLTRVLVEWGETHEIVKDPRNNENDEMLMIDRVLDKVLPPRVMDAVGYEKLLDMKGKEVK